MKIIAITRGYSHSVQGALVEMTGAELNILTGMRSRDSNVDVGMKLPLIKSVDNFDQLRRQFRDLGQTAAHLREVADHMDRFQLPQWSSDS